MVKLLGKPEQSGTRVSRCAPSRGTEEGVTGADNLDENGLAVDVAPCPLARNARGIYL
jgi:hypothetical protein